MAQLCREQHTDHLRPATRLDSEVTSVVRGMIQRPLGSGDTTLGQYDELGPPPPSTELQELEWMETGELLEDLSVEGDPRNPSGVEVNWSANETRNQNHSSFSEPRETWLFSTS